MKVDCWFNSRNRRLCLFTEGLSDAASFALILLIAFAVPCLHLHAEDAAWIRPGKQGDPLIWGRKDGIVFGLPSEGGMKGPRGLIRVGLIPVGETEPKLLNFIAIEPVVFGPGTRLSRIAFSELEPSVLDPGKQGKRFTVEKIKGAKEPSYRGSMETVHAGRTTVERLSVRINVERYTANGAHVYVIASIDSDRPQELRLSVFAEKDSPPLEELSLSATMGNYERLRRLWLRDRVLDSRELFPDYGGDGFTELENYPLEDMFRTADGAAVVYCTSDEADPATTPGNDTAHWPYVLPKLAQFWRVDSHDIEPDLRVRVNARRVYWASTAPVLGGIAFENFEVRQRYVPGQTFIYGITEHEPWELDPRLKRLWSAAGKQASAAGQ